ncbi:hypothetical protein D5S18_28080 [Nocardia panacis]|uniref:Uncharacterized protein n=1 Tax=Nocardia panacis TaxID=2340916 RepID=A0A3A4K8T6_9NOCA|nr:hypothetical protein [Nocardia panacis]RJO69764.1 hypothetical protein D5S18_28080 [Nocardia panacis]
MSTIAPYVNDILTLAGVLAGALGVWHAARLKTRMEARNARADDDIERHRLDGEHLKMLLDAQRADFESIVKPLRDDVDTLRKEVRELHSVIDALRARYRVAIDYIRQLLAWARPRNSESAPLPPQLIADEV